MGSPILPDDLLIQVADLERRLRILESTARVPQVTTVVGGPQVATVTTLEQLTGSSGVWQDLATAGPSVPLTIGPSGRVFALWGAAITSIDSESGWVGLELSGSNTVDADQPPHVLVGTMLGTGVAVGAAQGHLLTDLDSGETVFKLVYQAPSGSTVEFDDRWLVVWPL